ncbi:MAG TPA: murein L,D-transpeptidase catalytic domain family protein [Candidatus Polarisedimenticolaceae bacterium]|nr:murein L,D-transpeptidase catalytic domain family protein [Candidatus Polarisedimenticolaceae bacterium]
MKKRVGILLALAVLCGTVRAADRESAMLQQAPELHADALHAALASYDCLSEEGAAKRPVLSVIDYALPSTAKRLFVFDLAEGRLLYSERVAHGKNSGDDVATSFSNADGSLMSSLGAFVTEGTYTGDNGYSLRLRGTEPLVNDRAEARAIVMHGAAYVSDASVKILGRLGRSFGCPAIRLEIAHALIDRIKDGSVLYAWHPSVAVAR